MTDMVVIGAIERSFGVKGAMCVRPLSDVPGRFRAEIPVLLVGPEGARVRVIVTGVKSHGQRLILTVHGLTSPEEVATFRGGYVYAEKTDVAPPPGQYYQCDLLGMTVIDEQGAALGVLDHILETPAHGLFVVHDGTRELMIPAVREWVKRIDVPARMMTVRVPEAAAEPDRDSAETRNAM
ncbi:ribosome maturation factor RimM [Nitrospira sp.]|nr:ribosome maturation factor RimM [Nitrospira sp.]